jgi:mono/diheme cytochrome c family protein
LRRVSRFGKKDRSDLATATSNYCVDAIMKLPIPLLAVFVSLPAVAVDSAAPSNATNAALLEQGKKIFVTRCAKCHDNDANKKLPDGTTLLGRLAKIQDPEVRLGTRLKDPQERHAVMIYVDSLLKNLKSSSR